MTYLYSYSVSLHYKLYSISYSRNCNFKVTIKYYLIEGVFDRGMHSIV